MNKAEYSIHLGGGLYIDSNGLMTRGSVPKIPIYQIEKNGLPIKPDALEKALKGIKNALPSKNDPKSIEKLQKLHIPDEFINILENTGKIAGEIAKVVPYIGAAVSVLSMFGFFKETPNSTEVLIKNLYGNLTKKIDVLIEIVRDHHIDSHLSHLNTALANAETYIQQLQQPFSNPTDITKLYNQLIENMPVVHSALDVLLSPNTWKISFNRNNHKRIWYLLQPILFNSMSNGTQQAAMMPPDGEPFFDHRLMVPMVISFLEKYLALLRLISPEHRSTREYFANLKTIIDRVDILIENMRNITLARTIYRADFFTHTTNNLGEVLDFGLRDPNLKHIPPVLIQTNRFPVGAIDLSNHDDVYFEGFVTPYFSSTLTNEDAQRGTLNAAWIPPATLTRVNAIFQDENSIGYKITNPEVCAAAANAQSELDYATLLYSSGYLNLVHFAGLLRQQASHPDHSETVTIKAKTMRKALDSANVTVTGNFIFPSEVISSPASREPQLNRVNLSLTTQPLNRKISLSYRVLLRTIHANPYSLEELQDGNEYDKYYSVSYRDDPQNLSFQELVTSTMNTNLLDEHELLERRFSSLEPIPPKKGSVKLKAITFDWWIPTMNWMFPDLTDTTFREKFAGNLAKFRSFGFDPSYFYEAKPLTSEWTNWTKTVHEQFSEESEFFAGWIDGTQTWKGEHREHITKEVEIEYELHWQGDKMTISLRNQPEDRNYIVYLVIEEFLPDRNGKTKILHSAQRIPINGQLTYVPQRFFDQENDAMEKARKFLDDFVFKYSESTNPGPLDPVIDLIKSINVASSLQDTQKILQVLQKHQPELLQQMLINFNIDPNIINSLSCLQKG